MSKRRDLDWLRLDNAAKIFPSTSSKRDTGVFRFSCELKETIDPILLQRALDATVKQFPHFLSVLRHGLFWYYLERSHRRPRVCLEHRPICGPLYLRSRRDLLFEVSYYKKRINLEVYHALTDGTGALQFLKTLVYHYLLAAHGQILALKEVELDYDPPLASRQEDSFRKYYRKGKGRVIPRLQGPAYHLRGEWQNQYQLIQGIVSCRQALQLAKSYHTSLTIFLSAVLVRAIHLEMPQDRKHEPVVLTVPVNLRNYFPSETARNFFGNVRIGYCFQQENDPLEQIIPQLERALKEQLGAEQLGQKLGRLMALEKNPLLRLIPLPLKNLCLKTARTISDAGETAVISNVGQVRMPEALLPYIERMYIFSSARRLQVCVCSFQDELAVSFTSRLAATEVQRNFFQALVDFGLETEIVANQTGEGVD